MDGNARGNAGRDGNGGSKWIGKMGRESEIIVMKLARLPLSAFMDVGEAKGRSRPRALFHSADCYWLIDVDRIFFTRDASARGI